MDINRVLQQNKKVIIDFYMTECKPCQTIKPVLEELQDSYPDLKVLFVNCEDNHELAEKYSIRSVPTLLFFNNGTLQERWTGVVSKKVLEDQMNLPNH